MYLNDVLITNASLNVNHTFSYYSDSLIDKYKRVRINFIKNNLNIGIVLNSYFIEDISALEKEKGYTINPIIEVIDEKPIINDELYNLALWLSKITVSPLVSCINSMLPKVYKTSLSFKNATKLVKIHKNNFISFKTSKQKEVYDSYYEGMLLSDARKLSSSICNKLLELRAISTYEEDKKFLNESIERASFKELTFDQKKAYDTVLSTDKIVSLLFGVTGSGKTEVYLHLAKYYLSLNKEVLILVPEISLTPQMIKRVKERFNDVIFYHSELSDQERYEQYQRVLNQEVKIVVGTRSSIFLPFHDLGLIIVDEEHDQSYKQDSSPTYLLKNVAYKRALFFNAKLLLASATPSLDSYTRALNNEYQLIKLPSRINNQLPDIEIVDLNNEIKSKGSYIISNRLKSELSNCLLNHKQAIILLNRRGYSPILRCSKCGNTLMCDDCDIPLNLHNDDHKLHCHNCGRVYPLINECPKCHSNSLIYYGFGTQKVEESLIKLFPNAKIERMDRDTTSRKGSHEKILNRFENHEIDILIGTQMISKGLDYPDVTLVGILNADSGLMHQDYNSSKVCFDLLMQASGRSGRNLDPGKVIIQAFNPDHYVLKSVLKQDYDYFFNIEMSYRNKTNYPPYTHLLMITLSDINQNSLLSNSDYLYGLLNEGDIKVFKPVILNKLNKLNRIRILMIDQDATKILNLVHKSVDSYLSHNKTSRIKVDLDPYFIE